MRNLIQASAAALAAAAFLAPPAGAAGTDFGTKADEQNIIAGICGTQISLDAAGCTCFAEHAMTELDDPQRAYLILTVVQPPAAERLDVARSQEDLKTIFRFIESAQKTCTTSGVAPGDAGATPPADTNPPPQ
jgi:hypothetical protein